MKVLRFCLVVFVAVVAGCASVSHGPRSAAVRELVPTGTLRVGVAAAPVQTAFFVAKDASGQVSGVTVNLGKALARRFGVPLEIIVAPNSGELVNAISSGALDVTFVPVDDERRKQVDFGPDYVLFESTYLVRAGSNIGSIADVDRRDVRVVAIANTTTIRTVGRLLKTASLTAVKSVEEAMDMLGSGKADALALGRTALPPLAVRLPGSRILDGHFHQSSVAIAIPKNRPNALALATEFMEDAKASGIVQRAFEDTGLKGIAVAPPAPKR